MTMLRACLDRRVLAVLAAATALVIVFAPSLIAAALPVLVLAVCPLSMLVMAASMRSMPGHPVAAETAPAPSDRDVVVGASLRPRVGRSGRRPLRPSP